MIELRGARDKQSNVGARGRSGDDWIASPKTDVLGLEAGAQGAPISRALLAMDVGAADTIHPTSSIVHTISIAPWALTANQTAIRMLQVHRTHLETRAQRLTPLPCPPFPFSSHICSPRLFHSHHGPCCLVKPKPDGPSYVCRVLACHTRY
jgi:hypothetical protein